MTVRWQNVSPRDFGGIDLDTRHTLCGKAFSLTVWRSDELSPVWKYVARGTVDTYGVLEAKTSRAAKIEAIEKVQRVIEKCMVDINDMKGAMP